ncbi:MAG: glycosyltransferase [Candidatus Parcubacteria bacterium]|nr:glycosyltransferase [Candidatus Parcubacteria bacterium]
MNQKIKIVYIINNFVLGGAERLLLDICRKLDKDKFEITVITIIGNGPLLAEFKKLPVQIKIFQKKSKLGLGLIWQLRKLLKQIKPQIVHTHLFGGDTWGRIAAVLVGVPVIISTEHNMGENETWLMKKIKLILSWFTVIIIAVSQGVKAYSVKAEGIKAEKIEVIYNGVDLTRFAYRGAREIEAKQIKAVVVGRLEEQKGHQYLIAALPKILQKYPGFILDIIGQGSLEETLKDQVKQLGLKDKVNFMGTSTEIEKILSQMDLFILPSVWEGLGIVILEAQAAGLAVLGSNVGGIKEIIKSGQNGLLFEPKDPDAIFKINKN